MLRRILKKLGKEKPKTLIDRNARTFEIKQKTLIEKANQKIERRNHALQSARLIQIELDKPSPDEKKILVNKTVIRKHISEIKDIEAETKSLFRSYENADPEVFESLMEGLYHARRKFELFLEDYPNL